MGQRLYNVVCQAHPVYMFYLILTSRELTEEVRYESVQVIRLQAREIVFTGDPVSLACDNKY